MMAKKIILVTGGDGGYGNLGDEWLLDAVKDRYKKATNKYKVIVLKGKPPRAPFERFKYLKDTAEAFEESGIEIKDIAAVHYYGGGYLNSFWMEEKIWLYSLLTKKGFPKEKFFFTSLGLGPLNKRELATLRGVSKTSGSFGVRDRCFLDEVQGRFMFDESIRLIRYQPKRQHGRELWVNIRIANHVGADEKKLAVVLRSLDRLAKTNNLTIKYFSMIKGKDFSEKEALEKLLKSNGVQADVVERPKNYKGLLRRFENAAMVVTTSYHATLAALYTGTPVVALYDNEFYDYKYKGLDDAINSPLLKRVKIGGVSASDTVWAKVLKASDVHIQQKIEDLKKVNDEGYQGIEELLHAR